MNIGGSCHCGNIAFELDWPDDAPDIPARACGCSFCVKHGGVWTSHPRASLAIRCADERALARYRFGTGTAAFLVCARCGAVPVVTCDIDARVHAVVNVNTFDGVDAARLRRSGADFADEAVDSRLQKQEQFKTWLVPPTR